MRLLSPFCHTSGKNWRSRLTGDLVFDLGKGYRGYHEFYHGKTCWGILHNDRLTIFAGYASDLCSPGYYVLGRWIGTPSKGNEIPAYLHDFARQFMAPNVPCSPWDRKGTDELFFDAMVMVNFPGRSIYHGAVAGRLGSLWLWLNKPRPDVSCRCCAKP